MEPDELLISMILAYAVPEHLQTCWGMENLSVYSVSLR